MTLADLTRATVGTGRWGRMLESRVYRFAIDFFGYGLVSVVALACDYGLLLVLVHLGLFYILASMLSFSIGMVVAYALSIRFVFARRRVLSREMEAAGFFAVGLVGLVLTQALLYLFVSRFGFSVAVAKIPTTALVFAFNFQCRRGLVFKSSRFP